jgi:hypothetical protein
MLGVAGMCKRRHGPKPNPASIRQRLFAAIEVNKKRKMDLLVSHDDCIWVTSSRGGLRQEEGATCCQPVDAPACCEQYDAAIICRLRGYYHSLDAAGKRSFLAQRTELCTEDLVPADRPLAGRAVMSHFMEKPSVLHNRFATLLPGQLLPPPNPGDLLHVCKRFVSFATGGHNDTTYDQHMRVHKGPALKLSDLDLRMPRQPRVRTQREARNDRESTTENAIACFLDDVAEGALHLPNDDGGAVILPWPTRKAVHAAYVRTEEARLKTGAWDLDLEPVRKSKKQGTRHARYGNTVCGSKEAAEVDSRIASYGHFCRVWATLPSLRHIKIRRWLPFAKCKECALYRDLEARTAQGFKVDPEERRQSAKAQAEHLNQIKLERRHYYSNRLRATLAPETCMSVIIDGADQSKYKVPYHHIRSHGTDEAGRQPLHAYGAISHGRKAYSYLLPGHVRQGHDVTIEVLWRVICDTYTEEGKLPPVLFLQLDNTTKQNKGRFLFAFLALLVRHNVFDKICVSFLPVGHTHEDIDQIFSRFCTWLRTHNALCPSDMAAQMRRAYTYNGKPPLVEVLQTVAGMSEFLARGTGIELPECMDHRHFRIRRNKEGKTIIQARSSPVVSHLWEPWQGLRGDTLEHDIFPLGAPELLRTMDAGDMPRAALPENVLTEKGVATILKGMCVCVYFVCVLSV